MDDDDDDDLRDIMSFLKRIDRRPFQVIRLPSIHNAGAHSFSDNTGATAKFYAPERCNEASFILRTLKY
jgi:hypothetical protein